MNTHIDHSDAVLNPSMKVRTTMRRMLSTLGVAVAIGALMLGGLWAAPAYATYTDIYVVRPGDTLIGLAARYDVSVSQLALANGLRWNSWVYAGQRLSIPASAPSTTPRTHTVLWGETLSEIGRRYAVSTRSLAAENHILPPGWVHAGEILNIPATSPGVRNEYAEWTSYTNERFGYTLRYPGGGKVIGSDLAKSVQFVGPSADGEHWPWFFVEHYDSDFYHPPTGTDVRQWILDSSVRCEAIGPEVEIAGLPTLHLVCEASPQAYGADHYYFIQGDQLFHIRILHTNSHEDWELYEEFLQSFSFS